MAACVNFLHLFDYCRQSATGPMADPLGVNETLYVERLLRHAPA